MRARTTAHRRCAFSYAPRDKRDLPARGHRGNVSGMAFSHRRHDRAAQQLGRSAWLRQRFHARNVYSRSAPTAWRELCRHTATRYWPKACVRSTRATPPHALTITLTCPRSSAQPSRLVGHRVGDADDGTSRQRGAWDVSSNWAKITFIVSSLERPHRRGHRPGRHEHAKRRHEHATGDHEITPSSKRQDFTR